MPCPADLLSSSDSHEYRLPMAPRRLLPHRKTTDSTPSGNLGRWHMAAAAHTARASRPASAQDGRRSPPNCRTHPPSTRPGPSAATKIGPGFALPRGLLCSSARLNATPAVDEPRLPNLLHTTGNLSMGRPLCRASISSRRGFGWCVAKLLALSSRHPDRAASCRRSESSWRTAALPSASPSNSSCTPPCPSGDTAISREGEDDGVQPSTNSPGL